MVGWGFTFSYALVATAVALITLGRLSNHLTPRLLHVWSRVMLRIQRVDLIVENHHLITPRSMKVVLFTHASLLDSMIVTAIKPIGGVSAIKREVLYLPFVGVALWALGFLLIDRGRTDRAKRVLARAAARMADERLTVFIAPEGTRSQDGEVQPFKKGAFHLARASHAPIVPMIIDGNYTLRPPGRAITRPGRVRVRFLPPIPTDDLTLDNIDAFRDRVRTTMIEGLEALRAERA